MKNETGTKKEMDATMKSKTTAKTDKGTETKQPEGMHVDPAELSLHILQTALKSRRVKLEPELEAIAAFWPAAKRLEMARKFTRWARQLRISGLILFSDSHRVSRPVLRFVGPRKARLN